MDQSKSRFFSFTFVDLLKFAIVIVAIVVGYTQLQSEVTFLKIQREHDKEELESYKQSLEKRRAEDKQDFLLMLSEIKHAIDALREDVQYKWR